MSTVTVHAAKTNLSKLLARVEAGEEIVIARGAIPIARLTPIHALPAKRQFGAFKGVLSVGPEFFEPMTNVELAEWERDDTAPPRHPRISLVAGGRREAEHGRARSHQRGVGSCLGQRRLHLGDCDEASVG